MKIVVSRFVIIGLAAVFSGYHVLLAIISLDEPVGKAPYIAAIGFYALATIISLWPSKNSRMPLWNAALNVVLALVIPVLVTSRLAPPNPESYAAWHTAAIGSLMVITAARKREVFASLGVIALVLETVAWAGPSGLVKYGVVACVLWVGLTQALQVSLARSARDTQQYAFAEREAVEWRAAQEAHVSERQLRLAQTSRMSLPMLRQIIAAGGDLSEDQRRESLYLEGAIRDEIRGRKLLNDAVREQIMLARRRGTVITLLDEGGIDDLSDDDLERVLSRLAEAIRDTKTDKLIARTVPEGSDVAVTVVGLSSLDGGHSSAIGANYDDDEDDEVDLWLEIPRTATGADSAKVRSTVLSLD